MIYDTLLTEVIESMIRRNDLIYEQNNRSKDIEFSKSPNPDGRDSGDRAAQQGFTESPEPMCISMFTTPSREKDATRD